jgi:hypothetical protein
VLIGQMFFKGTVERAWISCLGNGIAAGGGIAEVYALLYLHIGIHFTIYQQGITIN